MKERIIQFLTAEKISPAEFADKIGVQRSSMSHILNGRNYPSASFIQKMLYAYPQLNSRWLMIGDGTMNDSTAAGIQAVLQKSAKEAGSEEEVSWPETEISGQQHDKKPVGQAPEQEISVEVPEADRDEKVVPAEKTAPGMLNGSSRTEEKNSTAGWGGEMLHPGFENEIEQVLFFYKDKTFKVYRPS